MGDSLREGTGRFATPAARSDGLIILGAGGHARSVADVALAAGFPITSFVDPHLAGNSMLGYPIVGTFSGDPAKHLFCIALGDNRAREKARTAEVPAVPFDRFPPLIHPAASVSDFARVGHGTVVMAGARIGPNSIVGDFCIVNTHASLDHDCRLANYASIAPRAVTGGFVTIGERSTIAIGAVVRNDITIGANTILGAASYLDKDLPDDCVAYGTPAKVIRTNTA
jgi:sugar O-acyltransferase (sialic acid O-acetyltransferase NeuD family)